MFIIIFIGTTVNKIMAGDFDLMFDVVKEELEKFESVLSQRIILKDFLIKPYLRTELSELALVL